ncbi:matrix remodeling-associated protein 8-like [Labeo rohita]|uniref:matrix remodeling-associated protein 8-like n=1 Tax=Labeo rohita TaxID=84645 RepID=UPI0021E1F5AC|nr:matrix remodeling-associated protein 8-like [Labeo rohita]
MYILCVFSSACTPSDSGLTQITAYSGGSVLLPCTCTNPQDNPKSVFWESNSKRASKNGIYADISSVFERYIDRITLFNQTSPGNVSLLLSDLTKDDQGFYVCLLDKTTRFINVTIEERSESTTPPILSHSVLISVPFLVIAAGGATIIYCIHRAHRKARTENGEMNVENNLVISMHI